MKSTILSLFIADQIIVDQATDKLSAIGLFSEVFIPSGEDTVLSFAVGGKILVTEFTPQTPGNLAIRIRKPDGSILDEKVMNGDIPTNGKLGFVAYFPLVTFNMPGPHIVEVLLNGEAPAKIDTNAYFNVIPR